MAEIKSNQPTVWIMIDLTASMGNFAIACSDAIEQIAELVRLTNPIPIGILIYRDYSNNSKIKTFLPTTNYSKLITKLKKEKATGGGDYPEASKTALNILADKYLHENAIVLHFTDAPPHDNESRLMVAATQRERDNGYREYLQLQKMKMPFDFSKICKLLRAKKSRVYTFHNSTFKNCRAWWTYLALATDGLAIYLGEYPAVDYITQTTMSILFGIMNCENQPVNAVVYERKLRIDEALNKSETKLGGVLPKIAKYGDLYNETVYHPINLEEKLLAAHPHDAFTINLRSLIYKFRNDENYVNVCFDVFANLMTPQNVVALTYNPVFGTIWRELCKRRDDVRRNKLTDKLSQIKNDLPESHLQAINSWLDASYDASDEINEILQSYDMKTCYTLSTEEYISKKQILEITRACTQSTLALISKIIAGISEITQDTANLTNETKADQGLLPVALPNDKLFQLIPHLISPGTLFNERASITTAALIIKIGNATLIERADAYLKTNKGTWFDEKSPENYTYGFCNLMLTLPDNYNYFTPREINIMTSVQKITGLRICSNRKLTLMIPYTPDVKSNAIPAYTFKCPKCKKYFDNSLYNSKHKVCALCLYNKKRISIVDQAHMAKCRTCLCIYSVVNKDDLLIEPKCHFCRYETTSLDTAISDNKKIVVCVKCKNTFIDPLFKGNKYTCAACAHNYPTIVEKKISVYQLVKNQKTQVIAGIGMTQYNDLPIYEYSCFKLSEQICARAHINHCEEKVQLIYEGQYVHNSQEIINRIMQIIVSAEPERAPCSLCFNQGLASKHVSACGNCNNMLCVDCASHWYGQIKPGAVVLPPYLVCPFCKRQPNYKTISRFNRAATRIIGKVQFDYNWYYAWCRTCHKVKQAALKTCSSEVPTLTIFQCGQCFNEIEETKRADNALILLAASKDAENSKVCPNCGIATVKSEGCNHITCGACGAHWCWECGKHVPDGIYDHMWNVHGFIYS